MIGRNLLAAKVAIFATLTLAGCSSTDDTTSDGGADSAAGDAGKGSTADTIAGIAVPASSQPLCTSATGGTTTAVSGSNPPAAGFSWSAAPAGTATHYAVLFKRTKGDVTDVLVERLIPIDEKPLQVNAPAPIEEGSYYSIRGLVVKDGVAVCVMDGANGISK